MTITWCISYYKQKLPCRFWN